MNYHENTMLITNENLHEKANALINKGISLLESVEIVNGTMRQTAVNEVITANGIRWDILVYGVMYEVLTVTDGKIDEETAFKPLKVSDCFILKANKNSNKTVIPSKLLTLVKAFGINVTDAKYGDLADDTLPKMVTYTKYNTEYECFTCETSTSVNQLEKQFQIFLDIFMGENVAKSRKTYVKHLKEQYVKAVTDGYKNGNEVALLQLIINHAFDATIGKLYTVKSGLEAHKKPKEKNA
jgi:hypothetical protein